MESSFTTFKFKLAASIPLETSQRHNPSTNPSNNRLINHLSRIPQSIQWVNNNSKDIYKNSGPSDISPVYTLLLGGEIVDPTMAVVIYNAILKLSAAVGNYRTDDTNESGSLLEPLLRLMPPFSIPEASAFVHRRVLIGAIKGRGIIYPLKYRKPFQSDTRMSVEFKYEAYRLIFEYTDINELCIHVEDNSFVCGECLDDRTHMIQKPVSSAQGKRVRIGVATDDILGRLLPVANICNNHHLSAYAQHQTAFSTRYWTNLY